MRCTLCIYGDDDVGRESESVLVRKCAHVEKWGVVGEVRPFGSKLEQLNIRNIIKIENIDQCQEYISRYIYIKNLFREGCR